jgi:hypothetical protein
MANSPASRGGVYRLRFWSWAADTGARGPCSYLIFVIILDLLYKVLPTSVSNPLVAHVVDMFVSDVERESLRPQRRATSPA